MTQGSTSDEQRLRSYLSCQAAIGNAALTEAGADSFAGSAVSTLATTLGARAVALLVPHDGELEVRAGTGWLPHVQPRRLPDISGIGARPRRVGDIPQLAGARLLRAHDLADGLVCDVVLPRLEIGLLGVFGTDHVDDPALVQLVASAAEMIGAGLTRLDLADQLVASERRLREAQELAHLGSYDWDIRSDTNLWSDELYRIYGAEPGEFNASYDEFVARIHPDDREKVMAVHRAAFETHEPYQMVERIVRPDGSVRVLATTGEVVVDEAGNPVRMRGICLDMTDRLEAEQRRDALDRAEERRRQAFQINDGVVQGLTSVIWAIEEGVSDAALLAAHETLQSARALMQGLLDGDAGEDLAELVRAAPPVAPLRASWSPGSGPAARPPEPPTEGIRIVIADDSEDLRLLLRIHLADLGGFQLVGEAATGPDAVHVVATTQPDLLLLDLAMPGGSGLDAIPEVRRVSPATRIVVLSGFSRGHLGDRALDAGADAYVEKGSLDRLLAQLTEEFPQLRCIDH